MQSTGSYWQTLFRVLQQDGFEVLLGAAIAATARKIAVIIWNMITKKTKIQSNKNRRIFTTTETKKT